MKSFTDVLNKAEQMFGFRLCILQIKITMTILHWEEDIVNISGTGSGKTLPFWVAFALKRAPCLHYSIMCFKTSLSMMVSLHE